ncbi:hypothetical protein KDL01_39660 [Actinospica durhamensis]|uniref:Uncharacterized protein n=1 Tax=Actinospica durhamensis TaxID=1508375 RepID=A0A941IT91_9ACTN|nr:hypothetical protein [Actinospica durhamensis]MBR7839444.1 hypothetical protein [Actinospica durhamensis]
MRSLRIALGLSTSLAVAAGSAFAAASSASAASTNSLTRTLFQDSGLTVQQSHGFIAGTGSAAAVKSAASELTGLGVGNTALYTGVGATGQGIVILTGNDEPEGTDFQVVNMTAAHLQNDSADLDAVYADDGGALAATVAPGSSSDITPVDVDFALYPPGATPPPDNRGLNPSAQFTWS